RRLMHLSRKYLIIGGSIVALRAAGAGSAIAVCGGDSTITRPRADSATRAALQITGGGTANSVELDNENGATYEVEVTKPDGNTVDVRLDESYKLVVVEGDGGSLADSLHVTPSRGRSRSEATHVAVRCLLPEGGWRLRVGRQEVDNDHEHF